MPPWEALLHFSPEMLHLLMEKRHERILRMQEELSPSQSDSVEWIRKGDEMYPVNKPAKSRRVSDQQLFAMMALQPQGAVN